MAGTDRYAPTSPRPRRRLPANIIVFVVFAALVFLAVKNQFPQLDRWVQRLTDSARWSAGEQCRRAAVAAATDRRFARVVDDGTIHDTEAGYYVENVVVGEPGADGSETRFRFSCYVDQMNQVVRTHRTDGP